MDAAGVVTELGPDVDTGLVPGDRVFTLVRPDGSHGAYREDLVVDAAALGRTPAGCTDVAASTLALNGCTARRALDLLALRPGQVVAVSGAAGAVGGFAVQLAKADGLTVVADAAAADEDLVRELGADVVVRRGDDVAARIREAFPDGVDGVVDAALLHELLTPAVRDGGGFATVRGWPGDGTRGITFPFAIAPEYGSDPAVLSGLSRAVEDGVLTLRVARTLPVEDAAEAHRLIEAGGVRGRLVLTF
jgi:NADPH:quinone reductase-like Zn-dependent oxidoreductase